jgi:hypothetical protein
MLHLHNENGKFLGWFTWKQAYDLSKNIDSAVYSFAFLAEKPKNDILPFEVEDTFYVGMSCGKYYDKKNKTSSGTRRGGELATYLQKRLLIHNGYLQKLKHKNKKSEMFFEHFSPQNQPQKERYVSISIPNEDMRESSIRAFVSLVESEYIFLYSKEFEKTPLLNFDEEYKPKRIEGSHSMRIMSSPTILQFAV